MNNIIDAFFAPVQFDAVINEIDYIKAQPIIKSLDAITRACGTSLYVIDYFKRDFLYVSPSSLFLNGYSAFEIQQMGYNYYEKMVPENDLRLLLEINKAGFLFYYNLPVEDRLSYTISYDFHIFNKTRKKQLINHKLTPILLNEKGQLWLALCIVSTSTKTASREISITNTENSIEYIYSRESGRWKEKEPIELSEREIEILRLSAQGCINKDIADIICVDINTVKYHKKNIFQQLNVRNINEAIAYANNKKLV